MHNWRGDGCIVEIPVIERNRDEPLRPLAARQSPDSVGERDHGVGLSQVLHLLTKICRSDRGSVVRGIPHLVIRDDGQPPPAQPRGKTRPCIRESRCEVGLDERLLDGGLHAGHWFRPEEPRRLALAGSIERDWYSVSNCVTMRSNE